MTRAAEPTLDQLVAGRYRIIERLGAGGMGAVYLAEKLSLRKKVALKVLLGEHTREPQVVARFEREALSAASIRHPNVVEVFEFGRLDDGTFFLEMEFLEGGDLREELTRHGALEPSRALRIALVICRALAAAHERGVVHRDMKPDNVFLQRTVDGEEIVKIVDFGIAQLRSSGGSPGDGNGLRLTRTGNVFGSPLYMSPEQANGTGVDLRTDVYAVGIMLYEMLTGNVPFGGDTLWAVFSKHAQEPVPAMRTFRPGAAISAELEAVVTGALEKRPEARYSSMRAFAEALSGTPEGRTLEGRFSTPATAHAFEPPPIAPAPLVASEPVSHANTSGTAGPPPFTKLRWVAFALLALTAILGVITLLAHRTSQSSLDARVVQPGPSPLPVSVAPEPAPAGPLSSATSKQKSGPPLCESVKDGIRVVSACPP